MPLSEHEQRLLEQMEQAMYAEDPKFASAMRGRSSRARQRRRLLFGGIGVVVGLVLVVLGVARSTVPIAVVGFVLMLAGAAFAATPERKSGPVGTVDASGATSSGGRYASGLEVGSIANVADVPHVTNELFDMKTLGPPMPKGAVFKSITGVVTYFGGFHIAPRSAADFEL